MALGIAAAEANSILDALVAEYPFIKLHVGDPGAAGTANAATETTRKQVTWGSASGGSVSNSAQVQWTNIAGSQDATHFSLWTLVSSGTFGVSGTLTANGYTAGDTYTIAVGDLDVTLSTAA